MNSVNISGRLTKEIDMRYTPAGKAVSNGTVAVQRKFKNSAGEYEADFIDFVAWGKTGELMAEHIKKGEYFTLSGELTTRMWEKNDGSKQKVVEINVQSFDFPQRPKGGQNRQQGQQSNQQQGYGQQRNNQFNDDPFSGEPYDSNDVPF